MGINQFDPSLYTLEYIPQKLRALDACIIACYSVLTRSVEDNELKFNLKETTFHQNDINLFVELAIDAGLIANRTLLNFMGIKLADGGLVNADYALNITEFELSHIEVSEATEILSGQLSACNLEDVWVEALSAASKSIAHFTKQGSQIRVARLGYACYATSMLVRKHFLEISDEVGEIPTSILPNEVIPKVGSVWDNVDPSINLYC
ncbi:hypothetical protein [Neptuniibacter sp. QD57_21]|uniref:hypothetical protein n=1 Tax=Neptuniibacter sp. QD57_21 TaxID=3398213 RepID=UPI0039F57523